MMTNDMLKKILQKSKTKKDGVYSLNGFSYMLCNGDLFIGEGITIYQYCYGFLSPVNKIDNFYGSASTKAFMKKKYQALNTNKHTGDR